MSRVVTLKDGSKWRERDKGNGVVERSWVSGPADIIRPGGTATVVGASPIARSASYRRDSIELREEVPAAFTLRLPWRVRKDIHDELGFVRHNLKAEREAGGWLFAQRQAGHYESEQNICRAVTAGTTGHTRTQLHLAHPIETW
jgi:hypothetical protein